MKKRTQKQIRAKWDKEVKEAIDNGIALRNGSEALRPMRTFGTGATRNIDHDKLDYEGFLSPIALKEFAKYMHKNRIQADGTIRDSANWQKGIPLDSYMKSMWRHFFSVWENHRGVESDEDMITSLSALMFNVQGYLHEYSKNKDTNS